MKISAHLTTLLLALVLPGPVVAQVVDEGVWVTRLGSDTISVERFTRSRDRLVGERITRTPTTSTIRYTATLDRRGAVSRFEATLHGGAMVEGTPIWTAVIEFGRDESVSTFTGSDGTRTTRIPRRAVAVPMLMYSPVLYDQAVRQATRAGRGRIPTELIYPGQDGALASWISPPAGSDTVLIEYFHDQPAIGRVDREGRLQSFDATGTVLKVVASRGTAVDLEALRQAFTRADSTGHGIGAISPRDTLRTRIGGVSFLVDYGRPSKRGRTILGGLVPWGQVWRTGANAATQFQLGRAVRIGEVPVPAGLYTLWTLPGERGSLLIINRESGQWGTSYAPGRDLARIPMETRTLDRVVERFTIELVPIGTGAELRLSWDTTEWVVPIRID